MPAANSAPVELDFEPQSVPLTLAGEGILLVSGTRVSLDSVVYAFEEGESPEGIVERFPTLELADVYQVLAYCLKHPKELAAYLARQTERAENLKRQTEQQFGPVGEWRTRLLARRRAGKRAAVEEKDRHP